MKNILMLGTGGTIASEMTPDGLTPELRPAQLLKYVPAIKELCNVDCLSLFNIDSTNITPRHWCAMAAALEENYDRYDGCVISHGTDTMAYTAAALSYMVQGADKPIMITGALIGNYLDMYRVLQAKRSRRSLADVAKDFGYSGKWSYRLGETERMASRFKRHQLEKCLEVLQKLDTDLKSSKLDADLLMQKALCELALAGRS